MLLTLLCQGASACRQQHESARVWSSGVGYSCHGSSGIGHSGFAAQADRRRKRAKDIGHVAAYHCIPLMGSVCGREGIVAPEVVLQKVRV